MAGGGSRLLFILVFIPVGRLPSVVYVANSGFVVAHLPMVRLVTVLEPTVGCTLLDGI